MSGHTPWRETRAKRALELRVAAVLKDLSSEWRADVDDEYWRLLARGAIGVIVATSSVQPLADEPTSGGVGSGVDGLDEQRSADQ